MPIISNSLVFQCTTEDDLVLATILATKPGNASIGWEVRQEWKARPWSNASEDCWVFLANKCCRHAPNTCKSFLKVTANENFKLYPPF
jgi:hypothetical protein